MPLPKLNNSVPPLLSTAPAVPDANAIRSSCGPLPSNVPVNAYPYGESRWKSMPNADEAATDANGASKLASVVPRPHTCSGSAMLDANVAVAWPVDWPAAT